MRRIAFAERAPSSPTERGHRLDCSMTSLMERPSSVQEIREISAAGRIYLSGRSALAWPDRPLPGPIEQYLSAVVSGGLAEGSLWRSTCSRERPARRAGLLRLDAFSAKPTLPTVDARVPACLRRLRSPISAKSRRRRRRIVVSENSLCPSSGELVLVDQASEPVASTDVQRVGVRRLCRRRCQHRRGQCWGRDLLE